jgi:prepilin-type processing-associated H-X9-DG protein
MRTESPIARERALTLVEVLAIIAVVILLAGLLMPARHHPASATRIKCVNNLKQVGLSFRIFATDHNERLPMDVPIAQGGTKEPVPFGAVFPHLVVVSNELSTTKLLYCPKDKRVASTNFAELRDEHLSYFIGLDAREDNPQSMLAGDRNIAVGSNALPRILTLKTNDLIHWTRVHWTKDMHVEAGNIVFGDGHVDHLLTDRLRGAVRGSGQATNRLAIP